MRNKLELGVERLKDCHTVKQQVFQLPQYFLFDKNGRIIYTMVKGDYKYVDFIFSKARQAIEMGKFICAGNKS